MLLLVESTRVALFSKTATAQPTISSAGAEQEQTVKMCIKGNVVQNSCSVNSDIPYSKRYLCTDSNFLLLSFTLFRTVSNTTLTLYTNVYTLTSVSTTTLQSSTSSTTATLLQYRQHSRGSIKRTSRYTTASQSAALLHELSQALLLRSLQLCSCQHWLA